MRRFSIFPHFFSVTVSPSPCSACPSRAGSRVRVRLRPSSSCGSMLPRDRLPQDDTLAQSARWPRNCVQLERRSRGTCEVGCVLHL
uniref:Putative secreted protein n=1 Tax=Ixodes ricinus TaxID=34613 RepID=A0A6B0TYI9_IXORI